MRSVATAHESTPGVARTLGLRELGVEDDGVRCQPASRYGKLARIQARLRGGPTATLPTEPTLEGGAFDGALAAAVRSGGLSLAALVAFTATADAAGATEGAAALGELVSAGVAAAPSAARWMLSIDSLAVEGSREYAKCIVAAGGVRAILRALRTANSAQRTVRGLWAMEALARSACDIRGDTLSLTARALAHEKWPRLASSIRAVHLGDGRVAEALADMETTYLCVKGWPRAAAALMTRIARTALHGLRGSCVRAAARATLLTCEQRDSTIEWVDDAEPLSEAVVLTSVDPERGGLLRHPSGDWWGTLTPR